MSSHYRTDARIPVTQRRCGSNSVRSRFACRRMLASVPGARVPCAGTVTVRFPLSTSRENPSGPFEDIRVESERGTVTRLKRRAGVSCGGENWIGHEVIADRLGQRAWFKVTPDGIGNFPLQFAQVDRFSRNTAATVGFVPRGNQLPGIGTCFDDELNLIHTHSIEAQVTE